MPDLFVKFSGMIYQKGIPRINLVMHAWTLWSVGQISSNDVVRGLQEYDESIQQPNNALQNNPAFWFLFDNSYFYLKVKFKCL